MLRLLRCKRLILSLYGRMMICINLCVMAHSRVYCTRFWSLVYQKLMLSTERVGNNLYINIFSSFVLRNCCRLRAFVLSILMPLGCVGGTGLLLWEMSLPVYAKPPFWSKVRTNCITITFSYVNWASRKCVWGLCSWLLWEWIFSTARADFCCTAKRATEFFVAQALRLDNEGVERFV